MNVTALLVAWGDGDESALGELIPLVHDELRRIARHYMAGERVGHSLQATALINEAYLRLVDIHQVKWQNRAHFVAMAARLMRRILIDAARSKRYQKRGAGALRVTFADELLFAQEPALDLIALDDALSALAKFDERKSRVVEMKFFGGLTVAEMADVLELSPETIMRDWKTARAWLMGEMHRRDAR